VDAAEELVDGLECLAVAGLVAHDGQGGGEQFQDGPGLFECLGLGADDDQQVTFAGALGAAGERSVNEGNAVLGEAGDRGGMASVPTVLPRITTAPGLSTAATPFSPKRTSSSCSPLRTASSRASAPWAASRAEAKVLMPASCGEFQARLGDVEAVDGQLGCEAGCHGQAHGAQAQDGDCVVVLVMVFSIEIVSGGGG
jgi:hypothetical protein